MTNEVRRCLGCGLALGKAGYHLTEHMCIDALRSEVERLRAHAAAEDTDVEQALEELHAEIEALTNAMRRSAIAFRSKLEGKDE
jgi:hypothetical protein